MSSGRRCGASELRRLKPKNPLPQLLAGPSSRFRSPLRCLALHACGAEFSRPAAAGPATDESKKAIPSYRLLKKALEIGLKRRRSFYESIYLALAVSQRIDFVTADQRLANAVAACLPVKWLGSM